MNRLHRATLLSAVALLASAAPSAAGLISITLVSGLVSTSGSTSIPDTLLQESLSGTTLGQLRSPLLYDPELSSSLPLTVRLTNTSDQTILFPEFLPGVSVLSGVNALPGESARSNVAAGGAFAKPGLDGGEGAISRTAIDLTLDLPVLGSPADSSHGGGAGAGTGVSDNLISISGASGAELARFLGGRTLRPGEWIDVEGFADIIAFHRSHAEARIGFGLDLPTFTSGGVTVTTTAWTGSFSGPGPVVTDPSGGVPGEVPEPATLALLAAGLGAGAARGARFRARRNRRRDGPRE